MKYRDIPTDKKAQFGDHSEFVKHIILKFDLEKHLEVPYDEIFESIQFPLDEIGAEDDLDVAWHVSSVEDYLYSLVGKKGVFIPYPEGETNRMYNLTLEEFYKFYQIKYTQEDISIPDEWDFNED